MIDVHKTYTSNGSGDLKVIKYESSKKVTVRFIDTGYETIVEAGDIIKGGIKDKLKPSVYGIGYIGGGKYKTRNNGKKNKSYTAWINMIARCYNPGNHLIMPTYKECSVADEWLNFQNFAKWFDVNYICGFDLDKDILVDGNKVYSPDTCLFVSTKSNSIKASAKSYSFINPAGFTVNIYNLSEFCISNNLTNSSMSEVHSGRRKHHKKWIKA